jgi:hypothetical protein
MRGGVHARVRLLLPERRFGVATGCRGGVHGGAQLDAMGGGERGARDWLARTRRGARRCVQATENMVFPPLGDRARVPQGHGGVTAARPS